LYVDFIEPRYCKKIISIIINILPLISQHIVSLLLFAVNNKNKILDEFGGMKYYY